MNDEFDEYLEVLNDKQREAVIHQGKSLLILAGAGSGKTRVITTKLAYLINTQNVSPQSILAVTFTKKAANEMKERAVSIEQRAELSQIRTFHSFGSWFLRKFSNTIGFDPNFTVYDDQDIQVLIRKSIPSLSIKEAKLAAHQISLAKDYCLSPEDDLSFIASEFDLNDIYKQYQNRLRATGNVDFGDLIMMPVLIMDENPYLASKIHDRFKVIMVDEYQDSNIAQYKLLKKLSGLEEKTNTYVCVVGDDDQSIYHFRGAEVQNILSFPKEFIDTDIIKLELNYRSTSKILNAASLVVQHNEDRLGKTLIAARGEGGNPVLAFLQDQNREAEFAADLIQKSTMNGGNYDDWAILYRTNAQSLSFEKELVKRKIPYAVVGSMKFYEREEVKDALSYLSLIVNPKDEISFRRVINKPSRGIGDKTQDKIIEKAMSGEKLQSIIDTCSRDDLSLSKKAKENIDSFCKSYEKILQNLSKGNRLSDLIALLIHEFALDEYYKDVDSNDNTQKVANLQELANSAASFDDSLDGLMSFLDSINLEQALDLQNENENQGKKYVTLITLHNTKGLEFNKVIITGLEDGIFPRAGKTGADLEEERRLFYVGITRAKNELYITSVASRFMYGKFTQMKPSMFIKESYSAYKVIGTVPYGFRDVNNTGTTTINSQFGEKDEIAEKWQKGTKIFHDDYGYGFIINRRLVDGEFVIDVQFENGKITKFLPEYQKNNLVIIKEK